jgi:hypothetical protein
LLTALKLDDMEVLRHHLFAKGDPNFSQCLGVVPDGGGMLETSTGESRDLSILGTAAQFGAVRCVQLLLEGWANVGTGEVEAAFRSGNTEVMRLRWDAFPSPNPLGLALEAIKSWNVTGTRWLLEHRTSEWSSRNLLRLFEAACSSGSYSCASSVLGFSASVGSDLSGSHPVGVVGRGLCYGLASVKSGREDSFTAEDSMAAEFSEEVHEWLSEATEMRLVARHEGRGAASVKAFIDAAKGRARTLTFVETENRASICGGYLNCPWTEGTFGAYDASIRSFLFTLRNHLGVRPTRFAQIRGNCMAFMARSDPPLVKWGCNAEGWAISPFDHALDFRGTFERAPEKNAALFCGDGGNSFRAGRWELWEVL